MGGTHNAVLSSSDYISQARRNFNNIEDGFYISPAFLDKMTSEWHERGAGRGGCVCGASAREWAIERNTMAFLPSCKR